MVSPDAPASRRDFEHLSEAVANLTRTLESLQQMMAATYVRQDVYHSDQKLHDKTHVEQAKDTADLGVEIGGLKDNNRWVWRTIFGAVLPILAAAVVTALVMVITGVGSLQ